MNAIVREKVGTANYANVPDQGYAAAHANAIAQAEQGLTIGSISEWWHRDTRRATFDAFDGHYRFGPRLWNRSPALYWDPHVWTEVRTGWVVGNYPILEWVGGRLVWVCDLRPIIWALLDHVETSTRVRAMAHHWATYRAGLSPAQRHTVDTAHHRSIMRTQHLACRTGDPAIALGDFNSTGRAFMGYRTTIGDRRVRYANLRAGIPDQAVAINGTNLRAELSVGEFFTLPAGDHRRFDQGPAVGLTTTLTIGR